MPVIMRAITGFRQDEEGHWIAELACGHHRHVRHTPPWRNHPWVLTEAGRRQALGRMLPCGDCSHGPDAGGEAR